LLNSGLGGGSYEKWLVNTSSNETNNASFADYGYGDQQIGYVGGQSGTQAGEASDASSLVNRLFVNSSLFQDNFTSIIDTTVASQTVPYQEGSLIVKGLDVGAGSAYEITADYAWSTATGSTGGGGGGGGTGSSTSSLTLVDANESYTIENERGGSSYEILTTLGQARTRPIKITNTGDFGAEIKVECEPMMPLNVCDYVKFNQTSLLIVPKQSKTTTFTFLAPDGVDSNLFKFNIVVHTNNPRIKGRLPVEVTITVFGAFFSYTDAWTKNFVINSPVEGGKDLSVPVSLAALSTFVLLSSLLGLMFTGVFKVKSTMGWLWAFSIGTLFMTIVPLFAL